VGQDVRGRVVQVGKEDMRTATGARQQNERKDHESMSGFNRRDRDNTYSRSARTARKTGKEKVGASTCRRRNLQVAAKRVL